MTRRQHFGLRISDCGFAKAALRALLLLALCALPAVAHAQSATATLAATITDQNSAAIPGVAVTVTNLATRLKREAVTNDEGSFTVPLLPPAIYTVGARRDGFAPVQINDLVLNVGDQKALKIELKAGDVNALVQVTGEAPLINESPAVATVVDRQFVGNLPLNGRSFQSLILLTPGVSVAVNSNEFTGGQFSVNGQRTNTNYFTVDGVAANLGTSSSLGYFSERLSGAGPALTAFGGTNNLVSIEALEEYRIQTSSYSAEFGRQPGGQVQLVTRSGGNQFHLSLFESLRNEALDANDWFNNSAGRTKAPLRQNLFGGTFSGAVVLPRFGEGGPAWYKGENRTFFFLSYEGLRLRLPQSGVSMVPSLRLRQAAAPGIQQFLNAFPIPTGPEALNASGQPLGYAPYNYSLSNPTNMDAFSLRIDHNMSHRLSLFGRYNEAPSSSLSRFGNNIARLTGSELRTRTLTFGSTMIFSVRLNNELRFNYSSNKGENTAVQDQTGGAVPVSSSALVSGYSGNGLIGGNAGFQFPGLNFFPDVTNVGEAKSDNRQINLVDNLSVFAGAHHLKFGADYRRLTPLYGPRTYYQQMVFSSEADIRNGVVSSLSIAAMEEARPRFENVSLYGQDTWHISRRLTMDMGIRWEFNPPPSEANGKKPLLVVGVDNLPNLPNARLAPSDAPLYKTFWKAFAPRIGVAHQISEKPGRETVLRVGFGVYYDLGNAQASMGFGGYPFRRSVSYSNVPYPIPSNFTVQPPLPSTQLPITSSLLAINPDLKLPYTLQWNVSVERAIGKDQKISASYVASAGRRLMASLPLNQPKNVFSGPRPNPNFGNIIYATNGPKSDYHSLQLQFQRRLSRGLQTLVNYTWSHAIDDISNESLGSVLLSFGPSRSRGNADFDVRHNLSAAFTYEIPKLNVGALTPLLRSWAVDGIVHAQSGLPLDVVGSWLVGADGTSLRLRPDLISGVPVYLTDPTVPGQRRFNPAAFQAPPTIPGTSVPARQGTLGRNALRSLPIYQMDVALRRRFSLAERWKVELKAEAFNVFNHPNFGNYGVGFQSPGTFGVPSTMLNRGLGGLSSLYQIGGPRSLQLSARMSF